MPDLFRAVSFYASARRYYQRGRAALDTGHLEVVRVCAIRVRELAYQAKLYGLGRADYVRLIHASDALIEAYWSRRQNLN